MNDSDIERLAAPLRAAARGYYADEAAVELLIGHGTWLRKSYFRDCYIEVPSPDADDPNPVPVGFVHWADAIAALDAHALPCSTSEASMLRIAASIGDGTAVDLRGALGGLDGRNLLLVLAAIAHANGHRGAEVTIR